MISWVNGRKYENLKYFCPTIDYFRLCFSFSCSGFDLTLVKKSQFLQVLHMQKFYVFRFYMEKKFAPRNGVCVCVQGAGGAFPFILRLFPTALKRLYFIEQKEQEDEYLL